jgi:hypothetical protein
MKRSMMIVAALLLAAGAAQATPTAVYAEVSYPTSTTWALWLTETTNWDGIPADVTPSGFGIAEFAIPISGVTTAHRDAPGGLILPPMYVGFSGSATVDANGNALLLAAQDTLAPATIIWGYGVTAGTIYSLSWSAPGTPGSATPGVLAYDGTRNVGQTVSITYGSPEADVFVYGQFFGNATSISVVPEPATLSLLGLGLLVLRRRR